METRTTAWIAAMAIVAAACSSSPSRPAATTTTPPSTTTTTQPPVTTSTTTTSTTTTTTTTTTLPPPTTTAAPVFAWDGDVTALEAPIDHLDGFRFELSVFDVDGSDAGPRRTGVFVAPRAVNCVISDPSFLASSSGIVIAFDDSAWFDDGVLDPEGADRSGLSDRLRLCPGAEEFWEAPVWASDLFELVVTDDMDDVDGFATRLVSVVSASEEATDVDGTMWVTGDGWPIKVEIEATVVGGVERVIASDDTSEDVSNIEIEYALTDVDAGALAVRAPDGTILAGPIGPIVSDVTALPPLEGAVLTATNIARGSQCPRENGVEAILGDYVVGDLDLSRLSTSTVVVEADGSVSSSIHVGLPSDIGMPMSTSASDETAITHALLYYRDIAPFVAMSDWVGFVPEPWEDPDGDRMRIPVLRRGGDGDEAGAFVVWDARTMTFSEPVSLFGSPEDTSHDLSAFLLLHSRDDALELSEDDDFTARAWMASWMETLLETLPELHRGDLQALADLEALAVDLDRVVLVACTRLGTYFARTARGFDDNDEFEVVLGHLADEISAQYLLLFLEYVQVLVDYLERPDVDWLQADGVDLETGLGAGSSDASFVQFLTTNALQLQVLMTPERMREFVGL